jgi:hypothetical protein
MKFTAIDNAIDMTRFLFINSFLVMTLAAHCILPPSGSVACVHKQRRAIIRDLVTFFYKEISSIYKDGGF